MNANNKTVLIYILLIIFGNTQFHWAKVYRLYVLAGQSNMSGHGKISDLPDSLSGVFEHVYIYHGNTEKDCAEATGKGIWELLRPGHGWKFKSDGLKNYYSNYFGVELSFAKTLRRLYPDGNIALIKYAKGGTAIEVNAGRYFGSWSPDFNICNNVNQYDHFLATLRNALNYEDIDGDGEKDTLIPCGIIWMQGESDAEYTQETALKYSQNLKYLINMMRAALRFDDLPVVIGRIADSGQDEDGKVWNYGEIIRKQQEKFVNDDLNAILVRTTDNYNYSDKWHYDSNGYIDLGIQFAKKIYYLENEK